MKFGQYIKDLRINAGMTLRHFCKEVGIDPSNWSKVERSITSPPNDEALMQKIVSVLKLNEESAQELNDSAYASRGQIPEDLRDEELLAKMPAFFRAMRGHTLTEEDFENLKQGVRNLHSK